MKKHTHTHTHTHTYTQMEDNLCKYTSGAVAQLIEQFTLKKVRRLFQTF